jgi:hypothetical protein
MPLKTAAILLIDREDIDKLPLSMQREAHS